MSVLRDATIIDLVEEYGIIDPFHVDQLQPASYDVVLGALPRNAKTVLLSPGRHILASTLERVRMPDHIVGRLEGKSTWARKGLIVHTAGFVDPGFRGQLVLEITNLSGETITLKYGDRIAQICFMEMDGPAERPYGHKDLKSHYQDQEGVTPAHGD
jgi:dCTP deaminase